MGVRVATSTFRVHIQPDKRFRLRDGSDTELDLPLAPWEAVAWEYHKSPDAGWASGTPYPSRQPRRSNTPFAG